MFLPNDVIRYAAPARTLRILWIDRARDLAHCFELGAPHALPHALPLCTLRDDVAAARAALLATDPYAAPPASPTLPQKYRDVQAKAWAIVSSLLADAPTLYDARARAALVAASAQQHGVSKPSILRYLRRYWERGQTPDALVPDYGNSGARGKTRGASAGVKRGRPCTVDGHRGLNIDARVRAIFRDAAMRYAAMYPTFSRRAAYRQMVQDYYAGRSGDDVPSFGQFNYWLNRDCAPLGANRRNPVVQDVAQP
jgi:hypothetical protein